jgi:hypothetical protein
LLFTKVTCTAYFQAEQAKLDKAKAAAAERKRLAAKKARADAANGREGCVSL